MALALAVAIMTIWFTSDEHHGHVHKAWKKNDKQINVGVDVWDFKPVSLEQLVILTRDTGGNIVSEESAERAGGVVVGIGGYPKVWNLGHAAIKDLFEGDVVVEEKVDGSQFSMMVTESADGGAGELRCRSKGQQIVLDAPDGLFIQAVESAKELATLLYPGWCYRCEYLKKPKHNALAYDRVPAKHLILFDVTTGPESYLSPRERDLEAARLGLEAVPVMYHGRVTSSAELAGFLERTSVLGGQKVEGVVIKNHRRFGEDGKALMGKWVSEAFKEVHRRDWKKEQPGSGDILDRLGQDYRSKARWNKAIQHLAEAGALQNAVQDIGGLIKEVQRDIEEECREEIKEALWDWAKKHVMRKASAGLPEWYKEQLAAKQFGEVSENG
jgi:hypothetical protein